MKNSISLSAEDQLKLKTVYDSKADGPKPSQDQKTALKKILTKASKNNSPDAPADWVGLGDHITLVSPKDPNDNFSLRIVLPAEANPDENLISVLFPISLAVIGQRCGENVSWETPQGAREMKIDSISKASEMLA